jgi:hypothetical protein
MRNFETFSSSYLLLFQCLTGDGWSTMMTDSMIDEQTGLCSNEEGNCGSNVAIPYFISFQFVGCFVFANLIVAVILENFATLHNLNPELVSSSDVELFQEAWAELDPEATNFIPLESLPALLLKLPPPLGLKGKSELRAKQMCMRLHLSPSAQGIEFRVLLLELVDNNYFRSAHELDEDAFYALVPKLKMPISYPTERKPHLISKEDDFASTVAHFFAIQSLLQEHVKTKMIAMLSRARKRLAAREGKKALSRAKGQGQAASLGKSSSPGTARSPHKKGGVTHAYDHHVDPPAQAPMTLKSGSLPSQAIDDSVAPRNGQMVSKSASGLRPSPSKGSDRCPHATCRSNGTRHPIPVKPDPRQESGLNFRSSGSPAEEVGVGKGGRVHDGKDSRGTAPISFRRQHNSYLDGQRCVPADAQRWASEQPRPSDAPSLHQPRTCNGRAAGTSTSPRARAQRKARSTADLDRLAYGSESAAMAASGHFTSLQDRRKFGFPLDEREPLDFASSLLPNGRYALPNKNESCDSYSA